MFFNPQDTEEMATVLEKTVQSETTLATLQERGQMREKCYSWDACVTQTAEVYRSVL